MNQPVLRLRGFQAYGMGVEMIRPMCAHPGLESIRLSSAPLYLNGRTELSGLPLNLKELQVMDYVVNEMSLTEVLSRCKKLQSLILSRQNLDNVDLAKVVLVLRRDGRNLKTLVLCVYPVSPPPWVGEFIGEIGSLRELDRLGSLCIDYRLIQRRDLQNANSTSTRASLVQLLPTSLEQLVLKSAKFRGLRRERAK